MWIIQVSIRVEKTVHSRFVAIHPFWIAHEVSNWLGIARREPGLRDRKVSQIACSSALLLCRLDVVYRYIDIAKGGARGDLIQSERSAEPARQRSARQ